MNQPTPEGKLPEIPTESGPLPAAQPESALETAVANTPTPAEDLAELKSLDCLKACVQRWKHGTHPIKSVETLLERRLPLAEQQFLAPFPLRVLSALAIVLAGCTTAWAGLWFVCWQLEFTDYVQNLSVWMSILIVSLGVIVLANPGRSYDESALEKAIREELQKLEKQTEQPPASTKPPSNQNQPHRTES